MPNRLFCFGLGYSALTLARGLKREGWNVAGTARSDAKCADLAALGIDAVRFDGQEAIRDAATALRDTTHVLTSIPPDEGGDPVLRLHRGDLAALPNLSWIGYLSTTGVYGNLDGAEADESTPRVPTSARGWRRVEAEDAWIASGLPVHLFRLAGIYGPGRSAIDQIRDGTARRLDKPGHRFSRIHVEDIAGVLRSSIARPMPGSAYNVCDDLPCESRLVIEEAARLLNRPPPPIIPFAEAALSPMARTFYGDNKTVSNARIKRDLNYTLRYPDYKAGLRAILSDELGGE